MAPTDTLLEALRGLYEEKHRRLFSMIEKQCSAEELRRVSCPLYLARNPEVYARLCHQLAATGLFSIR